MTYFTIPHIIKELDTFAVTVNQDAVFHTGFVPTIRPCMRYDLDHRVHLRRHIRALIEVVGVAVG